MKRASVIIAASIILLSLVSGAYAAEFMGYPAAPKQVKFYSIILGVIGAAVAMVSITYACMWIADGRKKRVQETLAHHETRDAFGHLLSPHPAK